jgi:zinc/manganese transport system substrate-binding protein
MQLRTISITAASALVLVSLAGCASANPGDEPTAEGLSIVASTNVWGDIASTIAGDGATVTSFISNATQDPHSYEASARDQLAISRADIVIENGGGYDSFMDILLDGSGNTTAVVINASDESSLLPADDHAEDDHAADDHAEDDHAAEAADDHSDHDHADEHDHIDGFNEHVWYSFEAVRSVADDIAHELGDLDPTNATEYTANYEAFSAEIDALVAAADEVKAEFAGAGAAITEPIPVYILEATGLINLTPEDFSTAFEEGTDVSPIALRDTMAILTGGDVSVFAYNDQTTSAQGEQVLAAATEAGIPVVSFSETLPEGQDYVSWMTANLTALSEALHS